MFLGAFVNILIYMLSQRKQWHNAKSCMLPTPHCKIILWAANDNFQNNNSPFFSKFIFHWIANENCPARCLAGQLKANYFKLFTVGVKISYTPIFDAKSKMCELERKSVLHLSFLRSIALLSGNKQGHDTVARGVLSNAVDFVTFTHVNISFTLRPQNASCVANFANVRRFW